MRIIKAVKKSESQKSLRGVIINGPVVGWCESADLGDFLSCAKIMESGIFV